VFADGMERLANYLDTIETWFDHLMDGKCEMMREYGF
jgi:hypothetical protein